METKDTPFVIINQEAKICWANEAAAVASVGAIRISDDFMRARRRVQQADLDVAIEEASVKPTTIVLAGPEGPTLVQLADIGDASKRMIALKWWLADNNFQVHYAELITVFHLTPAEHSVLLQLTRGKTADEAAIYAGISLQTVRSHIRQIYAKLNVRSREEMFFKIQPFRV